MQHDPRPTILFYQRDGCHLCEEARDTLQAIQEERVLAGRLTGAVRYVDIAADPDLERRYFDRIPVIAVDGEELPLAIGRTDIRRFLERTLGGALV